MRLFFGEEWRSTCPYVEGEQHGTHARQQDAENGPGRVKELFQPQPAEEEEYQRYCIDDRLTI